MAGLRAGFAGLAGLALLEGGIPPDDQAITRIAEIIRTAAPGMNQVYDLACSLFFLNRLDARACSGGDVLGLIARLDSLDCSSLCRLW